MMARTEDERSLQRWARSAGFLYLATNLTAMFGFYTRSMAMVPGDVTRTIENIVRNESLFRLGIAAELVTIAGVLLLVASLYVILEPIGRGLALAATFWRLAENIVLATVPLASV